MTAFLATENCFQLAPLIFGSGVANVETSLASTQKEVVPHTNVCTISPPAGRPPQWEDAADVPVPVRSGAVVCRSADGRLRGPRSWWGGLLGGSLTRRKLLMRWRLHGDEPRKPADAASTFADVPRWSRTPR